MLQLLQHQELFRTVVSIFKNEKRFLLLLCFQHCTRAEW